jgi:hypothetical protein
MAGERDNAGVRLTAAQALDIAFLLFEAITPAEEPGPHREDLAMDLGLWATFLLELIDASR